MSRFPAPLAAAFCWSYGKGGQGDDVSLSAPTRRRVLFVGCTFSLHSVFVDIERHVSEPAVPASGVNSLRTFHKGKVVALTCLRPLSKEIGESGGVLVTGGEWYIFGWHELMKLFSLADGKSS